ncbi:FAA hydrolase family protein [Agrobacterium vitis]|uniref:FAA hydrolase family protein n=1 Tax=Agrobacterium vitis TaxID=373 RepID=A0A6L6VM19_AGRVI|nr:fumarylacetoacetate hydrolase family protein [Agrobacterium vitis]MUZ75928.1 FAA hydrolase family protein [Agrobacterium vitis]
MSMFEFTPPAPASLAIHDSENRFPVRRIFCVGRNYAAHAREMGKDPDREPPFFFTKPADAVADNGSIIPYPPETRDFHYEIELIVAIGEDCTDVAKEKALDVVWGYGVGIDLTRRDLQLAARDKGRPWDWGKAFDLSAPIAPLHRAATVGHPTQGRIWLAVNGTVRQEADIAELIWDVPEIVSILSRSMALKRGDIIMTGTPAGVGAIVPGDKVTGGIDGLGTIAIDIAEPAAGAGAAGKAA